MTGLFDQALVSIQSPRNVPIVGVLSQDMIGRKKVFFTSLIRDSVVKPCDYPLMILSPEVDLLRSIKVTTLKNFPEKESFFHLRENLLKFFIPHFSVTQKFT